MVLDKLQYIKCYKNDVNRLRTNNNKSDERNNYKIFYDIKKTRVQLTKEKSFFKKYY
jgi:hypothetical protein